mmetsp:Transcript_24386/g.60659  ORF Transcript_24386/g.60659 Transcript_24386/m.60659 type:complete len:542 (-) Transcript_24386:1824-3449(-)
MKLLILNHNYYYLRRAALFFLLLLLMIVMIKRSSATNNALSQRLGPMGTCQGMDLFLDVDYYHLGRAALLLLGLLAVVVAAARGAERVLILAPLLARLCHLGVASLSVVLAGSGFELVPALARGLVRVERALRGVAVVAVVARPRLAVVTVVLGRLLRSRRREARLLLLLARALLVGDALLEIEEAPTVALVEAARIFAHRLHDRGPVQVGDSLVELDVARIEPRLDLVELLHVDRADLDRVLLEVLKHDHHVEVFKAEDHALKVYDLDLANLHDQPRELDKLDQRVDRGHDQRGGLVDQTVEAELTVRNVELDVARLLLDLLREGFELGVHAVAQRALSLFLLKLVRVVTAAARLVQRVRLFYNLDVELDVEVLFLAHHNGVVQVEVDEHKVLLVARLVEAVLHVLERQVHSLSLVGREAHAVRLDLERSLRFTTGGVRPHVHVTQPVRARACQHSERLLSHEPLLLILLLVATHHARAQLLNHAESRVEVLRVARPDSDLANRIEPLERVHQTPRLLGSPHPHPRRRKVDAEIGVLPLL